VPVSLLCFIHLDPRAVRSAGVTAHPKAQWMRHGARNAPMEAWGFREPAPSLLHDRDRQYGDAGSQRRDAAGVNRLSLPPRAPWCKGDAARWGQAVKEATVSRVIRVGESSLRHGLSADVEHDPQERGHQGLGHVLPCRARPVAHGRKGRIEGRERLGGLLKYYHRNAA
jgi:hypothetical protein